MAKKAKNGRRKYVRRPNPSVRVNGEATSSSQAEALLSQLAQAAQNAPRNIARSTDARSEVLGALAGVLSDVTTAVQALASVANTAPNFSNTETRQ